MDYASYLRIPALLSLQQPESEKAGRPAHDETLFIIVHQAYELWFRQVLHELDLVQGAFEAQILDDAEIGRVCRALERIHRVLKLLIAQFDVLETMTALDFLEFRDLLTPASGFQSTQFRLIETRLGLGRDQRLSFDGKPFEQRLDADGRGAVAQAEGRAALADQIAAWLERTPFVAMGGFDFQAAYRRTIDEALAEDIGRIAANPALGADDRIRQTAALTRSRGLLATLEGDGAPAPGFRFGPRALRAALFILLYRDEPALQLPFRLLSLLMDVDEDLAQWRYAHALMVSRMIGSKIGTGGSSGADYLRQTAEKHRVFGDLFALATFLIPRSRLPALPEDVRRAMRYRYAD